MIGVLILLTFLVFVVLMIARVLPALLALPILAVVVVLIPGGDFLGSLSAVFSDGVISLADAMVTVIFGAILAQVIYSTGIAESIIKQAAELAGDRPLVVALVMSLATFLVATASHGLGGAILTGTLVLPILLSVGIRPLSAASIFLASQGAGVILNVSIWGVFSGISGVPVAQIQSLAFIVFLPLVISTLILIFVNTRGSALRTTWAMPTSEAGASKPEGRRVPLYALIAPLIPLGLILLSRVGVIPTGAEDADTMNINLALLIGILYGVLTTRPRQIVDTMSAAVTEGIKEIAPVIWLFIGIGMLLVAVAAEPVQTALTPILEAVVPTSLVGYVLFFALLAPLSLYRGPLNLFGMGAGLVALLSGILAPVVVIGALMAVANLQAVSDPTNTDTVWTGQFTKVDVQQIMWKTLPYMWAAAAAGVVLVAVFFWTPS